MSNLKFSKVGDIGRPYPFLEVYTNGNEEVFMEINVNVNRELEFLIYESNDQTRLTLKDVEILMQRAKDFLVEVLNDEDEYNKWST